MRVARYLRVARGVVVGWAICFVGLGREAHHSQTTKRFPVCDHASMWRYYPPVPPLEQSRLGPCGAVAGYPSPGLAGHES